MLVRELLFELGFNTKKAQANAGKMDKIVGSLQRSILRMSAAAVTGAVTLGAAALKAGNDYQNMANKLNLVTNNLNELKTAEQGVFDIAQKSRTSLEASTDLYFGMAKAAEQYGISQERILRITETTAKLATLASNKDPAGTNAALFQLRQGIMSGQLRGQELNSVLEQATPVADAIAKGMGIPFATIRKQAEKGLITGIAVLKALETQADTTDKEFAKLTRTADQARTQLKNAFGFYAGRMAQDQDTVKAQVEFYDALREIISSGSFKNSLIFALKTMSAMITALGKLIKGINSVMDSVGGLGKALRYLTTAMLALTTLMLARAAPTIGLWIWYLSGLAMAAISAAGGFWALAAGVFAASLPFLAIAAAATALFFIFDDLWTLIKGGDSIIGRFFKNWEFNISNVLDALNPLYWLVNKIVGGMDSINTSKMNPKNWFGGGADLQADAAGAILSSGNGAQQTNIFKPSLSITVPPGTNKEQVDYMEERFTRMFEEQNSRQLRETRNNFPEVE